MVLVEKLVEHRLLGWANERIDGRGELPTMPYIRDMLFASIAHPWWSIFVLLSAYSIALIAIAHLSALRNPNEREAGIASPAHSVISTPPTDSISSGSHQEPRRAVVSPGDSSLRISVLIAPR